ncbi:leucine-rich repeat-containing protein 71-like isoform X2 [Branchiostoma lanceolatum]|uniref:leucine-rich repeat-containing protein 71-like isoform X2 n=1 Tax=Branchiostoma lanceolatum TaxID=7740 RepID=UPI0034539846
MADRLGAELKGKSRFRSDSPRPVSRLGQNADYTETLDTANVDCIARKVKMGKKLERVMKGDRGGTTSATSQETDVDNNKTPEPYNCVGDFEADYLELCKRAGLTEIPQVAPRPHRPEPPPPPDPKCATPLSRKETPCKSSHSSRMEKVEEPTTPTPGDPEEAPPTTYTTSNRFDYFRPKVQLELEKPEDKKSMTEIYIRGWKVDQRYMDVFRLCLPAADKLHTIDLWNVGLTDNTLAQFAAVASQCLNLRNIKLDGNPVPGEGFHQLIGEDSMIVSMSLRSCKISDKGAELIGKALSTVKTRNQSLCVLNLNSNLITDVGAGHLSNGLRMNRTLLILSVANNAIGDEGAKKFGEVLSRFALTHEEVVERRKLISEKGTPDIRISPIPKRSESRDRPISQSSRSQLDKSTAKSGRSSSKAKKKDDKGKGKDDKKKESVAKTTKGKGRQSGGKKGPAAGTITTEPETPEVLEIINPLLEEAESLNGELFIPGNRVLINLNLSRNKIGEAGLKALLKGIQYQITLTMLGSRSGGTGLMRLSLQKNGFPPDHELYMKIQELMVTRDPLYKPPAKSPDEDSISQTTGV